jgi:Fe-S cluster biogenesis protein NfuA
MKTLLERIEEVLNTLRPYLQSDGGDVKIVEVKGDTLVVKLLGSCENCNMNTMTMKAGLEQTIIKSIPEIKKVEAVS